MRQETTLRPEDQEPPVGALGDWKNSQRANELSWKYLLLPSKKPRLETESLTLEFFLHQDAENFRRMLPPSQQ